MKKPILYATVVIVLICLSCSTGSDSGTLSPDMFNGLEIRSIGPGTYAGRISDIEVDPLNGSVVYVAASTGGVFRTDNGGHSWESLFDRAGSTMAIGDMAIDPTDPSRIWVGTGEASGEQNPASVGDGIYLSTDEGKNWKNMGLTRSRHISRVRINPVNSNTVYAGATGGRWGASTDRGLYMTMDSGQTWEKVLYVDDNTGISDIAVHPDGKIILAATWEQRRSAWAHLRGGPGSGLYRSTDGGLSWKEVTENLPSEGVGRIALHFAPSDPSVAYACFEHDSVGLYRSEDSGATWTQVNDKVRTAYWYGRITVDPLDANHIFNMGTIIQESFDGGRSFKPVIMKNVHVDHHVLWIDPSGNGRWLLGNDGGFYISENAGESWTFIANLPIGQYYDISVDNREPYWIYGGLQDNGVWGGPSRSEDGTPVVNSDIVSVSGGDGFYSAADPENPMTVFGESQYGWIVRFDHETGERKRVRPQAEGDGEYRFNWNTPFFISVHPPHKLYIGAQKVLVSEDRGDSWTEISQDLTLDQELDTMLVLGRKPTLKPYNTITALTESPLRSGLIYAGTDDGRLFRTDDGGETWINLSDSIPAPSDRFFTRIVASAHDEATLYIGFGRFYEADDLSPWLFKSSDYGKSWEPLVNDLPAEAVVRALAEHPLNPDLLFLGIHNGLLISVNGGESWIRPDMNLPHVAIDDIIVQNGDLVLGSYGRGLWVLDGIDFLARFAGEKPAGRQLLFDPYLSVSAVDGDTSHDIEPFSFIAPEPPDGIVLTWYLDRTYSEGQKNAPVLMITEPGGNLVEVISIPANMGFNRFVLTPEANGEYLFTLRTGKTESTVSFNIEEEGN